MCGYIILQTRRAEQSCVVALYMSVTQQRPEGCDGGVRMRCAPPDPQQQQNGGLLAAAFLMTIDRTRMANYCQAHAWA